MPGRFAPAALALALAWTPSAMAPAAAQCRLCSEPVTSRDDGQRADAVRLEVEARLDFDRLVLLGAGDGTATLLPDGSKSTSGTLSSLGGRAMVGTVVVRGEPDRALRIDVPARIALHSLSGGSIVIESIATDLPAMPRLDSAGRLTFRFGGRLRVSGDAEGDYSGQVPVTVEYL